MLDHELITAVEEGKFNIWPVETIEEGIEILTGIPAGEPDEKGGYPEGTIHGKAMKKLRGWVKKAARLKKEVETMEESAVRPDEDPDEGDSNQKYGGEKENGRT
jgi:predicted ATP-dependent protease